MLFFDKLGRLEANLSQVLCVQKLVDVPSLWSISWSDGVLICCGLIFFRVVCIGNESWRLWFSLGLHHCVSPTRGQGLGAFVIFCHFFM